MPGKTSRNLKVAIVHDWLVGGGAERVVYELHRMFPEAPIYTSYCTEEWRERLNGKVVTGFLQRWPFSKMRKYVGVLRIWWFTHLDLSTYDLVISSSGNGEAKGIHTNPGTTHICYCHAPTHYYWRHYEQYLKRPGFGMFDPLARLGLRLLVAPLRRWDLRASKRPDIFLANSSHTQSEIKAYYKRDSIVLHPPIDTARFKQASEGKRVGFVTAGRQTPYKRNDLIVEACTKLGVPLKVIGHGPEHDRLVKLAGPSVKFLTNVTDAEMPKHLASAKAFLFAAFEDFGVTPVEALASGTPVIAYEEGGAKDYVVPGKTGLFLEEQTVDSLCRAIQAFDPKVYREQILRSKSAEFAPEAFAKKLRQIIDDLYPG
ncbi:MAG TPA: glycosyltransferase [Candidatus Saccharimonadales bacterium]|nr:glycosyltransferase [Candidatus Saccharimonadales bacterium]